MPKPDTFAVPLHVLTHTKGNEQSRFRQNKTGNLVSAVTYANGSTAFKSVSIKIITVLLGVIGMWFGGRQTQGR
jgi:hypothetical protein